MSSQDFNDAIDGRKKEDEFMTIQWRELPTGIIYHIDQRKALKLKEGTFLILDLSDNENNVYRSWAPKRLSDELLQDYNKDSDIYIRSNGLKQCKTEPSRSYYCYDIVER